MSEQLSRRNLIKQSGMIAVGLVAPKWLSAIAEADVIKTASGQKISSDTVLVVCQLSGGNDGLNTVIPYSDALYYKLRPQLGIQDKESLKISDSLALHPSLASLHTLFQEKKVAIIQNVGYPKPNRSHFASMDIWQSASPDNKYTRGWIGRHFDSRVATGPLNPVVAIGLSTEKPVALTAEKFSIPCFASLADIQNMIGDADTERMLREIQGQEALKDPNLRAVQQANKSALDSMSILNKQLKSYQIKQTYNNDSFGNGFKQISQIVATSPATRVVYFSAGGFDTHARQKETHANLLKNFSDAVLAFQREMEACGKADKVVVLVFSEFGRRVAENASMGTDHGAAAPMFVIGKNVNPGIHGSNPTLDDLADGDVKFKIDFREVYAATLDNWLGGDSEVVLGNKFTPFKLFK